MKAKQHSTNKGRRDIGQVEFLMEKLVSARETSSCCVGVEAALETNRIINLADKRRFFSRSIKKRT